MSVSISAAPAPLPVHLLELARDLELEHAAGEDASELRRRIGHAFAAWSFGDRRAAALWRDLRGVSAEPPGIDAVRARHALVGWGLPPVRADDAAWSAPASELRRTRQAFVVRREPYPRPWLEQIAESIGAPMPPWPAASPFDDDAAAKWATGVEAVRARLVAGVDQALDELEAREPAGVLAWWAHRLRELLVEAPVDDRGDAATSLRVLRRSGVAVAPAPAPSLRVATSGKNVDPAVTNESAAPGVE